MAISKTLVFLTFILIGVLLKFKFNKKEETDGIKKIILNLALPATIFVSLLEIDVNLEFLLLPVLALGLNILLFFASPVIVKISGIPKNSSASRTAMMLLPSLAPGLSCFPFVLEFLGSDSLAAAAMSDLGNKLFVLVILYLIAMRWFYKNVQTKGVNNTRGEKVRSLLKQLITEPVNMVILVAVVLVALDIKLDNFPVFVKNTIEGLAIIMTPLILLFIGLALKIKKNELGVILSLLVFRAGLVLVIIGLFVLLADITVEENILLAAAFSLSACSFWPFMHISYVDYAENKLKIKEKTFHLKFALAILAFSLPLSVILILLILSSGSYFANPLRLIIFGSALLVVSALLSLVKKISLGKFSANISLQQEIAGDK
ncbi:permease [Abyssalbus ytuae]|uniref:Permease n=1 Tax=Abyssalbus ytuae TaxID=2926907 RepID=A0A9E6ZUM2_9FLAO|nr:permease [Abyssalbus ytuae]UOB19233.1 permease [Abyssalbus ytuae]